MLPMHLRILVTGREALIDVSPQYAIGMGTGQPLTLNPFPYFEYVCSDDAKRQLAGMKVGVVKGK